MSGRQSCRVPQTMQVFSAAYDTCPYALSVIVLMSRALSMLLRGQGWLVPAVFYDIANPYPQGLMVKMLNMSLLLYFGRG